MGYGHLGPRIGPVLWNITDIRRSVRGLVNCGVRTVEETSDLVPFEFDNNSDSGSSSNDELHHRGAGPWVNISKHENLHRSFLGSPALQLERDEQVPSLRPPTRCAVINPELSATRDPRRHGFRVASLDFEITAPVSCLWPTSESGSHGGPPNRCQGAYRAPLEHQDRNVTDSARDHELDDCRSAARHAISEDHGQSAFPWSPG
jgi:hypothetical protein